MPDVGRAFVKVLALLYGFITWVCFALMALKDGKMFQKPSAIAVERLRNGKKEGRDELYLVFISHVIK